MGLKDFNEFSAEEIGLWLTAQGLGDEAPKFIEEGVDGDLLCSLTKDELKDDLGLSSLQAKKVLKNIEFSKHLKDAGEGGGEEAEKLKEAEIAAGGIAAAAAVVDAVGTRETNAVWRAATVPRGVPESQSGTSKERLRRRENLQMTSPPPPHRKRECSVLSQSSQSTSSQSGPKQAVAAKSRCIVRICTARV